MRGLMEKRDKRREAVALYLEVYTRRNRRAANCLRIFKLASVSLETVPYRKLLIEHLRVDENSFDE